MLTTLKHQEKGENIIERPHKSYFCNSFAGPSVSVFIEHMSGQCSDAGEDFLFQEADDQTEVIVCVLGSEADRASALSATGRLRSCSQPRFPQT